jgi:NADH-quinone oxidoreductase subunit C
MSDPEKPQSDNTGETKPQAPAAKAAAADAKPAAPAAKAPAAPAAKEPPPPPQPGEYGLLIESAKLTLSQPIEHLGKDASGVEMIRVAPKDLLAVAGLLKDNPKSRFDLLVSVTGVDWKDRLEAVYHVYSTETHQSVALKVTAEDEHIPSITPVWPAANWHERETFDLLGIIFDNHPDLTRILMPSDWIGYPLRKDYKVTDPRLVWNER